jgi:glycine/D-amino acid oxidase-like deaminating enzyme
VCIVGGGFTGLWTAYELRRAAPELDVVVLEAAHVGFGASGRNGGWVLGAVSGTPRAWRRRRAGAFGQMATAVNAAVDEIEAVVRREAINCDWHRGGSLTVAQNATQLARLRRAPADGDSYRLLGADEVRARVAVAGATGALYTPWCARVQPARLVSGLAAAAERAGAVVHESTRVLGVRPGEVATSRGVVHARTIVLATEGYTVDLPGRRRMLLPLNSAMIVTEPLPADAWAAIGWDGGETLLDGAHAYTYAQRTADGRIAIGGRGVPYRFGSRTDREGPVPERTVAELRDRLAALFPVLRDVRVARAWHGVLGVARDWCPMVTFDGSTRIGFAGGYAGEGVAASNLAGRTLTDLVLGRDTELTRLPWVGAGARSWEPEPLRFLGTRAIYRLYRAADRAEAARDRPSSLARVADLLAGRG